MTLKAKIRQGVKEFSFMILILFKFLVYSAFTCFPSSTHKMHFSETRGDENNSDIFILPTPIGTPLSFLRVPTAFMKSKYFSVFCIHSASRPIIKTCLRLIHAHAHTSLTLFKTPDRTFLTRGIVIILSHSILSYSIF